MMGGSRRLVPASETVRLPDLMCTCNPAPSTTASTPTTARACRSAASLRAASWRRGAPWSASARCCTPGRRQAESTPKIALQSIEHFDVPFKAAQCLGMLWAGGRCRAIGLDGTVQLPASPCLGSPVRWLPQQPGSCLSWHAANACKLAGPDHDARRVDGPHPGFRGLDPSVQAARARLAVSVGKMRTAPPLQAARPRLAVAVQRGPSPARSSPALQTAEGVCCILGASVGVAAAAACCANAPCTLCVPCRSVVETIKIVTETLEALFNMRLAIPAGVVRCLTEGVDNALQK